MNKASYAFSKFISWAKPMKLWQIGLLFIVIIGRFLPIWTHEHRRVHQAWSIPAQSNLKVISGRLAPPIIVPRSSRYDSSRLLGQLIVNGSNVVEFSCEPGESDLGCIYTRPYINSELIGKPIAIHYFIIPTSFEQAHSEITITSSGVTQTHIPEKAVTTLPYVVMQAEAGAGPNRHDVLSYRDSVERLQSYKHAVIKMPVFDLISWLFLFLLLPGIIYRIVTGKSDSSATTSVAQSVA